MKVSVEAFIICWNEQEIIQYTLNHYSSFCEKITLIDNYSTDDTIAIAQEKCPGINIIQFDTNGKIRDDILLEVKNNCWKKSESDYVIVCDTDEFLYAENMKEQLLKLRAQSIALPVVIGYNMGSLEFPGNYDIPIFKQVEYGVRAGLYDKQIIFSPDAIHEINFSAGCHSCIPTFKTEKLRDSIVEFKLLHYKYLGKDYVYRKHKAYASRLSGFNKENKYGMQYLSGESYVDGCFNAIDEHVYKVV